MSNIYALTFKDNGKIANDYGPCIYLDKENAENILYNIKLDDPKFGESLTVATYVDIDRTALIDMVKQYYIMYYALMEYLDDNKILINDYEVSEYEDRMIVDLKDKWKEMLGETETSL